MLGAIFVLIVLPVLIISTSIILFYISRKRQGGE
jgi:hypothetical protein